MNWRHQFSRIFLPYVWLQRPTGALNQWPASRQPKNAALFMAHWIGDTFWDCQVLDYLSEQWPDTRWTIFIKGFSQFLFEQHLNGDRRDSIEVIVAPWLTSDRRRESSSWLELSKHARQFRGRFDFVADLMGNRYSAFFGLQLQSRYFLGFEGQELQSAFSQVSSAAQGDDFHLCERPWRVFEVIWPNILASQSLKAIEPRVELKDLANRLNLLSTEDYIIVSPDAGWPEKQWSLAKYRRVVELLDQQGKTVYVTGSSTAAAECEELCRGLKTVQCLAGKIKLREFLALVNRAKAVICNDSAPGHLAAAAGVPVTVLFTGVTRPERCGAHPPIPTTLSIDELKSRVRNIDTTQEDLCPKELVTWLELL